MTLSTLPPEIRELPISVRVALAQQIWDSIADDAAEFELTASQLSELDRRLSLREYLPSRGSDWLDVKRRILDQT